MLKSYIIIALRSFKRNRLISFINIFGLGLSMSVAMMIMIRLQDQLAYDNFHPNPQRTYRITSEITRKSGEHWKLASSSLPLAPRLLDFRDAVETSVTVYPSFNGKATAAGKEIDLSGAFTSSSFFSVFGFTMVGGERTTALDEPNTVVITKKNGREILWNK